MFSVTFMQGMRPSRFARGVMPEALTHNARGINDAFGMNIKNEEEGKGL
jgi:hypothetical protein